MGNQIPNRVNSQTQHAFTSVHPLRFQVQIFDKTPRYLV